MFFSLFENGHLVLDTSGLTGRAAAMRNRCWPPEVASNVAVAAKHVHRRCRVFDANIRPHRDMRLECGPHTIADRREGSGGLLHK